METPAARKFQVWQCRATGDLLARCSIGLLLDQDFATLMCPPQRLTRFIFPMASGIRECWSLVIPRLFLDPRHLILRPPSAPRWVEISYIPDNLRSMCRWA